MAMEGISEGKERDSGTTATLCWRVTHDTHEGPMTFGLADVGFCLGYGLQLGEDIRWEGYTKAESTGGRYFKHGETV
jgi:hypothetical protein